MPTYEYQCGDCGYQFEQVQKITEDSLVTCPTCGKDSLRRLMSAPAFHLKGSGWYKTDYASSSSGSSGGSSSASSSTGSSTSSVTSANAAASTFETNTAKDSGASTATTTASDSK